MPKKKSKAEERGEEADLAMLFKSLSDPTRLHLLRCLRARCGPVAVEDGEEVWMRVGPTLGEVCCDATGSKKITALVSHHLKEMRVAGLIAVKRRGKNMICGVRREPLNRLSLFLDGGERFGEWDEPSAAEPDPQPLAERGADGAIAKDNQG